MKNFFVLTVATSEDNEAAYQELAKFVGMPAPDIADRIYSIEFHDDRTGERCVATVGEQVTLKRSNRSGRGSPGDLTGPYVLAIFPGGEYAVVTASRPLFGNPSPWENPFWARPTSVTKFCP